MGYSKPNISLTTKNGSAFVTVSGTLDVYEMQSVEAQIDMLLSQGNRNINLDVSQASFLTVESISALIRTIRDYSSSVQLRIVATGTTSSILERANLGSQVGLYSSWDQVPDTICQTTEYYTSRWVPRTKTNVELPLAA